MGISDAVLKSSRRKQFIRSGYCSIFFFGCTLFQKQNKLKRFQKNNLKLDTHIFLFGPKNAKKQLSKNVSFFSNFYQNRTHTGQEIALFDQVVSE